MSIGVHHPYPLDLCADDEDPSQLIIRPGWDAPHIRCFPRVFCAWPCLLRQVGTALGSPYDCIMTGTTYANPGSRQHKLYSPWEGPFVVSKNLYNGSYYLVDIREKEKTRTCMEETLRPWNIAQLCPYYT